jgi:hypothetical protein
MKKLLLIACLLTAISSYAQLEKGSKLIGIQTNVFANDTLYKTQWAFNIADKDYGLNIIPTCGYALQRNWLIGAQATFGFESVKTQTSPGFSYTVTNLDLGFAPFTRLYLDVSKNKKWKLFAVTALEIFTNRRSVTSNGGSVPLFPNPSNNNVKGSIGGGLGFFGRTYSIDVSMNTSALRLGFYKVLPLRKK